MNKLLPDAASAVADIPANAVIMAGGFGLCGIPENLILAIRDLGVKGLTFISNNAGVGGASVGPGAQRVHELSQASFDGMLAINLTGVFLCMKHELVQMLAQNAQDGRGGSIVNTASVAGLIGLPMGSHYVAAKHGVVGLTKTAAMEYAKDGIRVNCVNPGYVTSPMTAAAVETRLEAMMAKVPMGRMGTADEIAEGVVWMLSDKASFMTGASHVIDGGYYAA